MNLKTNLSENYNYNNNNIYNNPLFQYNPIQNERYNTNSTIDFSKYKIKSLSEMFLEEKNRRKKIISSSKIERSAKCFFLTSLKKLEKLLKKYSINHLHINSPEENEYLFFQRNLISSQTTNENLKESFEFQKLIDEPIVISVDCFFLFPDKYVLKGIFSLAETQKSLYDFVKKFLNDEKEKFNLFVDNYLIQNLDINLISSKIKFPAVFKIVFPFNYCKLKENELNKLIVNVI